MNTPEPLFTDCRTRIRRARLTIVPGLAGQLAVVRFEHVALMANDWLIKIRLIAQGDSELARAMEAQELARGA